MYFSIFSYFYLLIFYYHAQNVNILTFEIHEKISARKYAILADSAMLWLSEYCKRARKKTDFLRLKRTEKRPKSIDIER